MALRPVSRVWQGQQQLECLIYFDESRARWEVRMKKGTRILHHVEVEDVATAYMTAVRWRRDAEYLSRES